VRILLATDAWPPQVNGVVHTLAEMCRRLAAMDHSVVVVHPGLFHSLPCPFYSEIRLALPPHRRIAAIIDAAVPEAIHIATEGPIGVAVRRWCLRHGREFTTAFHTRFAEYLAQRGILPARVTYGLLRRFHAPSGGVMVASDRVRRELAARGFRNLKAWGRGVDTTQFSPDREGIPLSLPRPIFLAVGRVAPEKNLPGFLSLDLPGSKVVAGDGPQLAALRRRFPDAQFLGRREHRELGALYAAADVLVFPSRTDTFGLVVLEALACGLPVAAYPVPGPLDILGGSGAGVLDEDLRAAALAALQIPRDRCRARALDFTWEASAREFVANLLPLPGTSHTAPSGVYEIAAQ
jgi:glycosyltransferase involved in cell wall biosynthesis